MLFAGFVGPAYRTRSIVGDAEVARNIFLETITSAANVKHSTYYGTPGLRLLLTVDGIGCRGSFSQDALSLVVVGETLYSIDYTGPAPAATAIAGSIVDDGKPVFFASNGMGGNQVGIAGGGQFQILDTTTMLLSGAVALPLTNRPTWLAFIDTYFILGEADTIRFWFSNQDNGLVWDALDFAARSNTSDNIVGGISFRNRLWIFGSLTSQVYYDSGDADNPFIPYPGSLMQEGLVSVWAVGTQGESIVWMSQDSEGTGRMVRATDYAPTVISTVAISYALARAATLTDVELAVYEQEGHPHAVWTCPSLGPSGQSWGWDAREEQWHERSSRNVALGQDMMWRARGLSSPGVLTLCGDRTTGNLYALDLDTFDENGDMIIATRRAPYVSGENQWLFLDRVELGSEAGVGLANGQGSDPQVGLNLSRDGGHTWEFCGFSSLGKRGEYEARAIWYKLGRVRADLLVLEVFCSDPVRRVWGPGLWLMARPGTGQR